MGPTADDKTSSWYDQNAMAHVHSRQEWIATEWYITGTSTGVAKVDSRAKTRKAADMEYRSSSELKKKVSAVA